MVTRLPDESKVLLPSPTFWPRAQLTKLALVVPLLRPALGIVTFVVLKSTSELQVVSVQVRMLRAAYPRLRSC